VTIKEERRIKKMQRNAERELLKSEGFNRHHIIPKSKGGSHESTNIAYVDVFKHQKYHELFGNKTPPEVIEYLVKVFFNNNWGYVFKAIAGGSRR